MSTPLGTPAVERTGSVWPDPDDLRHGARISVWVRWLILLSWIVALNYRNAFLDTSYVSSILSILPLLLLNAYVHYHLHSDRTITWRWLLVLSAVDVVIMMGLIAVSDGFQSAYFVGLYPLLAVFAAVFTSFRVSFAWTTMVALVYVGLSLAVEPGLDLAALDEKILVVRLITMYTVVGAVHLIVRFERIRRLEAVERVREQERERQLQTERIELSQIIHDTIAQSAYVLSLGIESAIEAEDPSNREQVARLQAMHALSKSAMWELRHPIDIGLIFRGRELGTVLGSHAAIFTSISSVPAEVVQSGDEPALSTETRGLLFSIAHNAMANALRHASADKVTVTLDFQRDALRMSVSDDGVGLPSNYAEHGHGFPNMRADAERMGGTLEVASGELGRGTTVTCVVPYERVLDVS